MSATNLNHVLEVRPRLSKLRQAGFLSVPVFWIGVTIFVGLLLFCFVGPLLDRTSPLAIHMTAIGQPPSATWPLGTDDLGRNEMVRLMYGGRLMLLIGLVSAATAAILGFWAGVASGLYGGMVDRVLSWTMDVITSVPQLVPLLLFQVLVGASPLNMIVVIAATSWPFVGRPIRAEVISLRTREFIVASETLGARRGRIIIRHLLPNLWHTLLSGVSTCVGTSVLVIATASFLGFNLPPPYPDWGSMIASGTKGLYDGYWWLLALPAACLVLLQLAVNFMADSMSESLESQQGAKS